MYRFTRHHCKRLLWITKEEQEQEQEKKEYNKKDYDEEEDYYDDEEEKEDYYIKKYGVSKWLVWSIWGLMFLWVFGYIE